MNATEQATKVIGDILQADPQIAHEMRGDEPDQIARALADAGLLAPAPLREVTTAEELDAMPADSVVRFGGRQVARITRTVDSDRKCLVFAGLGDNLSTINSLVMQRMGPATVLYVPVDRAEGDGGGA